MKPNRFFAILRQIAQKGGEWDVTQVAASMAFYTLFSLFPLILLLISIGSVLLKNPETVDQILRFVGETLPAAQVLVNENITNLVQQRGPIGLVGFVSLLWSASNVFTTLSAHINSAWPASKKRNYLETRLVGLGIVGAMVIALVGYILGTILLQLITWLRLPILGDPRLSNAETWGRVWQLLAWLVVMGLLFGTGPLTVGDAAPDFQLPAATKDSILAGGVKLSDAVGKNLVILAFYPADWSGGCTKEMCTFRDDFGALGQLDATVFGISGDYVYSHREWASRLGLPFTLLSDHAHEVAKQYGSYNEKTGHDLRTVFVVDRHGRIGYIDRAYQAGSAESFGNLKAAIRAVRGDR